MLKLAMNDAYLVKVSSRFEPLTGVGYIKLEKHNIVDLELNS